MVDHQAPNLHSPSKFTTQIGSSFVFVTFMVLQKPAMSILRAVLNS